jgi:hypothetical protein
MVVNDSTLSAVAQGGDGNDSVDFNVVVETRATTDSDGNDTTIRPTVFARTIGGNGRDAIRRSSNVSGDTTNEGDAVLS